MKQGIQEVHRAYVLAPADKAANNVVAVWRIHYINTLIQELVRRDCGTPCFSLTFFGSTKTYERISADERSIVNTHYIDITAKFAVGIEENRHSRQTSYIILVTEIS